MIDADQAEKIPHHVTICAIFKYIDKQFIAS